MNGNNTTLKGNREIQKTFAQNLKNYRLQKNLTLR
ncbi:hypothetical protein J2Z40_002161 [Cytobacillus eiseniae]|uniref:XRE family transcriptional regulator n=1 Tax=Cytobacillus eiseniae TaxID=762947 RepID=A0ABS4RFS1_9BACI|nr:hypothetical protein [Cytobacillus eiseniae]